MFAQHLPERGLEKMRGGMIFCRAVFSAGIRVKNNTVAFFKMPFFHADTKYRSSVRRESIKYTHLGAVFRDASLFTNLSAGFRVKTAGLRRRYDLGIFAFGQSI